MDQLTEVSQCVFKAHRLPNSNYRRGEKNPGGQGLCLGCRIGYQPPESMFFLLKGCSFSVTIISFVDFSKYKKYII